MNEVIAGPQSSDEPMEIKIGARFGIYCAVWLLPTLLAAVIPDRDFTTAERFQSIVDTPLVAAFGIALIGSYPSQPGNLTIVLAATLLIAHAFFTLTQIDRKPFAVMIGIQIIILATAAVYLARFGDLSSG